MLTDLKCAQEGRVSFDAEKYVNKFHAKKHDHFLIPAGTIHCSSKTCMVLEIILHLIFLLLNYGIGIV